MSFKIREYAEGDESFIIGTFLDSFASSYVAGPFPWTHYRSVYRAHIEDLVSRADCKVLCLADKPSFMAAWALTQTWEGYMHLTQPVLHYVYVKKPYRKAGFASALLKSLGIDPKKEFRHTHDTYDFGQLTKAKRGRPPKWDGRFDPTLARYPEPPSKWRQDNEEDSTHILQTGRAGIRGEGKLQPRAVRDNQDPKDGGLHLPVQGAAGQGHQGAVVKREELDRVNPGGEGGGVDDKARPQATKPAQQGRPPVDG